MRTTIFGGVDYGGLGVQDFKECQVPNAIAAFDSAAPWRREELGTRPSFHIERQRVKWAKTWKKPLK